MGEAADKVITILQINDTHGYLEEHQEMFWDGENKTHRVVGGYPRIKSYLDQVRADPGSDRVIALDNGDTLHESVSCREISRQRFRGTAEQVGPRRLDRALGYCLWQAPFGGRRRRTELPASGSKLSQYQRFQRPVPA